VHFAINNHDYVTGTANIANGNNHAFLDHDAIFRPNLTLRQRGTSDAYHQSLVMDFTVCARFVPI
jgi:hypothetical protein